MGSSIKGDREFAVPIRASLSKPSAGRIKAQSHLPANPPPGMLPLRHCFLFFPSGKKCSSHSNPLHRVPHPCAGRSGHPNFPRTVHQRHFKGADQSRRDAGAPRQRKTWFPLSGLEVESHICLYLLNIPTSSCFLKETTTKTSNKIMPVSDDVKGLSGAKGWPSYCPYPCRVEYIETWGH